MLELDRFAHIDSPLQRWDARWKLAAAAVFVVATILLRHIGPALVAVGVSLSLIAVGRLPCKGVLQRVRPVIILMLIIVGTLALTGSGGRTCFGAIPLSRSGLATGMLVAAKALAIVLALVALVSTTPAWRTLAAMRRLHLPGGLVQVTHLAYRYVFLIQTESRAVQTAMRARGFRSGLDRRSFTVLGNAIGMLLIRSTERAERVYLAMQARGFDGSFRPGEPFVTNPSDVLAFVAVALLSLMPLLADVWLAS